MPEKSEKLEQLTKEQFLEVIEKLPHSKTRVPYTYHHDYMRMHSNKFSDMSRCGVAANHNSNDVELHAVALTQILDELGSESIQSCRFK